MKSQKTRDKEIIIVTQIKNIFPFYVVLFFKHVKYAGINLTLVGYPLQHLVFCKFIVKAIVPMTFKHLRLFFEPLLGSLKWRVERKAGRESG